MKQSMNTALLDPEAKLLYVRVCLQAPAARDIIKGVAAGPGCYEILFHVLELYFKLRRQQLILST